jgi:tetrahydromethanopterin S-methyltransferase subunit C
MEPLIDALAGIVGLIVGAAIWAVLFVVILHVLKEASPFTGWTRYVIAACVSLLSVIGMFRMLRGSVSPEQSARDRNPMGFILLPYAAMGIAILATLLLLLLRKLARRRTSKLPTPEFHLRGTSEEEEASERSDLPGRLRGGKENRDDNCRLGPRPRRQ